MKKNEIFNAKLEIIDSILGKPPVEEITGSFELIDMTSNESIIRSAELIDLRYELKRMSFKRLKTLDNVIKEKLSKRIENA